MVSATSSLYDKYIPAGASVRYPRSLIENSLPMCEAKALSTSTPMQQVVDDLDLFGPPERPINVRIAP